MSRDLSAWQSTGTPKTLRRYGGEVQNLFEAAVREGKIAWRFTGSNHLEVLAVASGARATISTTGHNDPHYSGKLRSFIRKSRT